MSIQISWPHQMPADKATHCFNTHFKSMLLQKIYIRSIKDLSVCLLGANVLSRSTIIWASTREIENTKRVSFDIKFTRQGFENAC